MLLSGRRGRGSGSKSCRRAGAGRLFCVGRRGGGGGRRLFRAGDEGGSGSESCRRASTGILFCVGAEKRGRRQELVLRGRKGEFRLEELPQGGHRETALHRGGEEGEAAGDCSERENGGLRARRIAARRTPGYCSAWGSGGEGVGMGGGRQEIVLSGRNGDFGLEALPLSWRKGVRCRRLAAERAPGYCSALGKERKGRRQEMVLSGRGGLE